MSTSTATTAPAFTIPSPVDTLNRSTYTIPLSTGHVVNMVFAMPLRHRIGQGDTGRVRPINTFITRPEYKTVSIGKAAQILIDEVAKAVVVRENELMTALSVKPIHANDKGRYEREFGYMDLDRLIECLTLEQEYGLDMEGAHGITEMYVTRDAHDDEVCGLKIDIDQLSEETDIEKAERFFFSHRPHT